jgi:hypothetical protein
VKQQPDPTLANLSSKWCTNCGKQKSIGEFDRDRTKTDGHKDTCKPCRADLRKLERINEEDPEIDKMEQDARDVLATLTDGGSITPKSEEFVESIMKPWGGSDGFAKYMFSTYLAAKPGSPTRERILSRIMDVVERHNNREQQSGSLEDMDTQSVNAVLIEAMKRFQQAKGLPSNAVQTVDGKIIEVEEKA